ncbi:transmembrane protein, putative [Medicago truncatula]|uniref:Transmembrane protein, putative n=1 Tax=Medicago truncatula TaxID=3880 RepID=G7JKX3_MEDTR|nr:transmembrane protein, putative [Medicago truncatula]
MSRNNWIFFFILRYIILGNVIAYPKLFPSEVLTGKSGNMYYTKGSALEFQKTGNKLRDLP